MQEQDAHNTSPSDSLLLIPDSPILIADSSLPCSASTELSGAETAPDPQEPPIIKIILNDGSFHSVYTADVEKWGNLYPAVDILAQLRKMAGWADANPKQRKTSGGVKRFVNSWLAREQDKGGSQSSGTQYGVDGSPHPDGGVWLNGKQVLGV